jgi:hypothetical protein
MVSFLMILFSFLVIVKIAMAGRKFEWLNSHRDGWPEIRVAILPLRWLAGNSIRFQ